MNSWGAVAWAAFPAADYMPADWASCQWISGLPFAPASLLQLLAPSSFEWVVFVLCPVKWAACFKNCLYTDVSAFHTTHT